MIQEAFANRVKELRVGFSMSQADLSNLTTIERAQISKIEKGKINVTLETIEKISNAFNISVTELMTFENKYNMKPFVKWAGGKTQILEKLKKLLPQTFNNYFEPFVGGGALFFSIAPKVAYLNDMNSELLCVYKCLKNNDSYSLLVEELIKHESKHSEKYFYQIREMDRDPNFDKLPIHVRAGRMIYLNKSCFNGLYRVNGKGFFNVPSAKKEKVIAFDRENLKEIKRYFKDSIINISEGDFESAVKNAQAGDFVYFDPPYDVFPDKNGFVDYSKEGFGKGEQVRLAKVFKELSDRGVNVMLSNHNTEFINELYRGFNIHVIEARRMINSNPDGRGAVEEVIVTNY